MKILKRVLLVALLALAVAVYLNYPKLNILSGYSAKYTNSSVFVANRTVDFTDATDLNFSPVNLADDVILASEKQSEASVYGLLERKAVYREGLGSVLVVGEYDATKAHLIPKRLKPDNTTPFPYGNAEPKDSIFANINYEKLNKTVNSIFNDTNKSRAVVVVYKDHIVAEKYADGFDKNSRILGWSMAKSITSSIFGVLQHQGKLNVKNKAPISEWQYDERKEITIHNLLQMNSGLEWDENYEEISDVTKMLFLERDMTQSQAKKPLIGKPNATFNYSSGTTNLLSGIARKTIGSHQEYLDYWYTNFVDKIGMNSMLLETDMEGNYVGSSYAWATARDWAKFGLVYLHNGNWNGTQIFDKEWSTYVATPTPTSDGTYGAQFWLNANEQFKGVPKTMYFADGYQGQRVYILPEQDIVIVRMALGALDETAFLNGVLDAFKN